jgi:D-hexose-6-phosphate mutarotase
MKRRIMTAMKISAAGRELEIPGRAVFAEGPGSLAKIRINSAASNAETFLQGAHVTHFQKNNEPPLLFLSQKSRFAEGQAIRGGIPVILPWFGAREGQPAHGFARTRTWELKEIVPLPDGTTRLLFSLPDCAGAGFPPFTADYIVTVGEALGLQLVVSNASSDRELVFENCLHTYFAVGDISAVSITGLKGVSYRDKVENFAEKTETGDAVKIVSETDRVYQDTTGPAEIHDAALRRRIRVEKNGSASTVVWNPWIAKAREMADFGDEEYKKMVCVESGNVGKNKITLAPGKSATLAVKLSSAAL